MFTVFAWVGFIVGIVGVVAAILFFFNDESDKTAKVLAGLFLALGLLAGCGGYWAQTHRIVPVQQVGVARNRITQDLSPVQDAGLIVKPFFGSVHTFPSATDTERCEVYTPAIKGSIGITLELCFYFDTTNVDWRNEIQLTGSLNSDQIMAVWRNKLVSRIANTVKTYTPEEVSANRNKVETDILAAVQPWFAERGIPLVAMSFKNWDFTSVEVAQAFDESIVSQRKIAEQQNLLLAAQASRERELYEAETAQLVAEAQDAALEELDFEGELAIQYLWIKMLTEQDRTPDTIILGQTPVTVPTR